jgi:hypothetical protein
MAGDVSGLAQVASLIAVSRAILFAASNSMGRADPLAV